MLTGKLIREFQRLRFQLSEKRLVDREAAMSAWAPHVMRRHIRAVTGLAARSIPLVTIRYATMPYAWDCVLQRTGQGVTMQIGRQVRERSWTPTCFYASAYLRWLMHCPPDVRELAVSLSDGNRPSAARFAPSTNRADVVALPDPFFFDTRGFEKWHLTGDVGNVSWDKRTNDILWIGAANGFGSFDPETAACPPMMAQRLALCLALKGIPDARGAIYEIFEGDITLDVMRRYGIGSERVPEESWSGRKFAIDIDGETNAWSNLLVRFHLGCCVLKVDSRFGYRQWYYDRIRRWEHFIPVRADLSDLAEKIDWARSNDRTSRDIAENGRAFARTLTYEAGLADAVRLIRENWRPYAPFVEPGQGSDDGEYGS
jgi:hypothetical protein